MLCLALLNQLFRWELTYVELCRLSDEGFDAPDLMRDPVERFLSATGFFFLGATVFFLMRPFLPGSVMLWLRTEISRACFPANGSPSVSSENTRKYFFLFWERICAQRSGAFWCHSPGFEQHALMVRLNVLTVLRPKPQLFGLS